MLYVYILFGPFQLKLAETIFKNSVCTTKKAPHFSITKINLLTLFKKIITVYTEIHMKQTNKNNADFLIVEAGGTFNYHQALKG
jgi:hypothetical protein